MQAVPFTIERAFDAPVNVLWRAITDKDEMKQWYFDLKEFKAEPGFKFSFTGGEDDRQYLHLCEVIDVIPDKKISYTWKYDGYPGLSKVIFELFPEGAKTRLKLTHEGLETFPASNPDLAKRILLGGWKRSLAHHLGNILLKDPPERGCRTIKGAFFCY